MYEKTQKIVKKLMENGWEVTSVEYQNRHAVYAEKKFAKVSISTEMCECHGGRMWINDNHTGNHFVIEHETYDESLGINDPSSELDYIIENEMMEIVNLFDTFVYKLTKINEYGKDTSGLDKETVKYFNSMKALTEYAFGEEKDIFAIEKIKKTYPNPNVYDEIERVYKVAEHSWQRGRIWFVNRRYEKDQNGFFQLKNEYEMYISIFEKR